MQVEAFKLFYVNFTVLWLTTEWGPKFCSDICLFQYESKDGAGHWLGGQTHPASARVARGIDSNLVIKPPTTALLLLISYWCVGPELSPSSKNKNSAPPLMIFRFQVQIIE